MWCSLAVRFSAGIVKVVRITSQCNRGPTTVPLTGWPKRKSWLNSRILALLNLSGPIALLALACLSLALVEDPLVASPNEAQARVASSFGKLPPFFIENQGQLDPNVAYYLRGHERAVYFHANGLSYVLDAASAEAQHAPRTVGLDFIGARPDVHVRGEDRSPATLNYFIGSTQHHRTDVPTYGKIIYEELWPGIDVVYTAAAEHLKCEYLVRPGADPKQIRFVYRRAAAAINDTGDLEISTPIGSFRDNAPYVYQEPNGRRAEISASYELTEKGDGPPIFGFNLGAYDSSEPLVIDPAVLIYAGYIGGAGFDEVTGVAADPEGYVYITGRTSSAEDTFPVRTGPELIYNPSHTDAFVAKLSPDGAELIWAGYIGGASQDRAHDIAVDGEGNVYVTGETFSTANPGFPGLRGFPATVGPDLTYNGGDADVFVAKVNADGTGLLYAGFIGGVATDRGFGVAVDAEGSAYVTGTTESFAASFPVRVGPDLTFNGSDFTVDSFVAKVAPDGASLLYAGYIGGSGFDKGHDIAVDAEGHAYVAGSTSSSEATFPVRLGPDLTWNGSLDGFIAKVAPDGASLAYAGYLGGSSVDSVDAIVLGGEGSVYLAGQTRSTEASFPVSVGPDLTYNGSDRRTEGDAFVAKLNDQDLELDYAGYLGGSGGDAALGIAVDDAGNAYVAGITTSTEDTFSMVNGPDDSFNGGISDSFVATLAASGDRVIQLGYLGGTGDEEATAIAVDRVGNVYIAGTTTSTEASFPVETGPYLSYAGGESDGFIAKLQVVEVPRVSPGGIVNSAGYAPAGLFAPESWVAVFGERLASQLAVANFVPFPASLGGTSVVVIDSDGVQHSAPLQFVSSDQINFLAPADASLGAATVRVIREDGGATSAGVRIEKVAPGLFSMNASGSGVAAGFAVRVKADGSQLSEPLFRFDEAGGRFEAAPIEFGPEEESLFLVLFGTGLRGHSGLNLALTLNGQPMPISFAGPQSEFAGLDQLNAGPLPTTLAGTGIIQVRLSAGDSISNTVEFQTR